MLQYAEKTVAGPSFYAGTPPDAGRVLLLDDEISKVQGATSRVEEYTHSVRGMADNIFGPQPEPSNTAQGYAGEKTAMVQPRAEGLRTATNRLHESLHALEYQLSRFKAL